MAFNMKGKVVIVTGGAKGIGAGISQVFVQEQAQVILTGRKAEEGEAYAQKLSEMGSARFIQADVTDFEATEALYKKVMADYGKIDIVILNAGYFPENTIAEMTLDQWKEVLDINLNGVFYNTKAAMNYLKEGGRIVITSSITGNRVGNPRLAHYSAAKGGVNGFMRTAALELAKKGITINAVEPGNIMTPGMKDVLGEAYIKNQEQIIPMGNLGEPEDIAYAALFLASEEAKYITGQSIIVDGGQTLPESQLDL